MHSIVTTFPLGARTNKPPLGILTAPILASAIHQLTKNSELKIAINTLDSYLTRGEYFPAFQDAMTHVIGNDSNKTWHDLNEQDKLTKTIQDLEEQGHLKEERTKIKSCSCGIVEMLNEVQPNPSARFYNTLHDDTVICDKCNTPLRVNERDVLVMEYPPNIISPQIYPQFMEKEVAQHLQNIQSHRFLASRHSRNGPEYVAKSGKNYSLDVDFFWLNYLSTIKNDDTDKIVVVGSNHVAWHLSLATALFRAQTKNKKVNLDLILTSYIKHQGNLTNTYIKEMYAANTPTTNKIITLSSLSWNKKDSTWYKTSKKDITLSNSEEDFTETYKTPELQEMLNILTNRKNIELLVRGKLMDKYLNSFYYKALS